MGKHDVIRHVGTARHKEFATASRSQVIKLPSGKQRCIHGPAVNVPSKLDSVCTVLPRLPSQSELIPLKLKCQLAYKGHYLYDYVTTEKILNALKWLKVHNPLYASVEINEGLAMLKVMIINYTLV